MIIVCSGPDTFRAREKARELVEAFRAKHDTQGLATERVDGGEGLSVLVGRLGTPSLFTPKRLVRADGCLVKMKIAEVRQLAVKLEADKDGTIVLTVEDEAPASKVLEALKKAPVYHYNFPTQKADEFLAFIYEQALKMGVDKMRAKEVSEKAEGDTWLVMQELSKLAAYADAPLVATSLEAGLFATVDATIQASAGWRKVLSDNEDENLPTALLSQCRSVLRVRDGRIEGIHPYVAKKLKYMRVKDPDTRFMQVLRAIVMSRSGFASGLEIEALF